ncbi:glycosyltransferase [Rhodococcus sp. HNM0569]|uniref:glycosyltransferase n=1 Tax=Rhodococcus sp. HNM0569 TaxID=2716340 RepID=UPI00146EC770|nr:glycosyltransferase [Rhodococcus sp. HNM0569]NLU83573.1 glycosyltransferase family 2 protein [Rhodococcus sp. HNM0569]
MSKPAPVQPVEETTAAVRSALVDHAAPERFVVHRGVFTGPTPRVKDDMYARIVKGKAHRQRFTLHLEKGATVDTDTYFGRFAASYFQRWTTVTDVQVRFRHDTAGPARVLLRASDSFGSVRTVSTADFDGAGECVLDATLDTFLDGGSLWVEFTAIDAPLDISDLAWTVDAPEVVRPAAIAICTFNRADDCTDTLASIAGDDVLASTVDAVYVVDQGTDHVSDRPLFNRVAQSLGDKLVYLRQPNLGGAGGFTRGMYEVSAVNDRANVILMDDDILCEPESILRMNAFANLTPEPTLVGAQMLYLMNPDRLHVSAEEADLSKLKAGRWAVGARANANMVKKRQDKRVDAGYNAWWSCLIPAEVISKIGLPLPLFFQWDDIEYGIRARAAGYVTVTLPNAGVWHADFHWKDRDDWAKYFSIRNSLIAAALHSDIEPKAMGKLLAREISQYVVSMQYGLAYTMIRGIEDFLAGPDVLVDGGQSVLKSIRDERSRFPETVKHAPGDLPGIRGADLVVRPAGFPPRKDRLDLVLAKRVAFQLAGRTRREIASIPAAEAQWWHVSLFETAVVTDASQSGVRIRRRDVAQAKELGERTARLIKRFRDEVGAVSGRYRAAVPQLTSRDNWARLYGLDESE